MKVIGAGTAYFLIVFACGFVLGAIRMFLVTPVLGAFAATLVELPIMLIVSWLVAGWIIAWMKVADTFSDRLVMGAVAFVLLMAAEFALGTVLGRSFEAQMHLLFSPAGLTGLAGQVLFGLMPLLVSRQVRSSAV
ncbi:MAG: hypothetical protein LJE67_09930 [Salaquimonas sp.]|nr:hypothetical protein [Salaquimonas sp.]